MRNRKFFTPPAGFGLDQFSATFTACISSGCQIEFTIWTGIFKVVRHFSAHCCFVMRLKQLIGFGKVGIFQRWSRLAICRRNRHKPKFPVENDTGNQRCKSDGDKQRSPFQDIPWFARIPEYKQTKPDQTKCRNQTKGPSDKYEANPS